MNQFKIMLIQPSEYSTDNISKYYKKYGHLKIIYDLNSFKSTINLPPLGLLYLAAPLLKAGHEVKVLDAVTLQLTNGEIVQEAIKFKPDMIGVTLYSPFIRVVHSLAKQLKAALDAHIVVGGPHATAMPEHVLEQFQDVDYVYHGWGEFTIADFVEYLKGNRASETIDGLCYRRDGKIIKNRQAELPQDENLILWPAREAIKELYDNHMYFNIMTPIKEIDVLMTSRNCHFRCNFCYQQGSFFAHSPKRVMDEIHGLIDRGIRAIEIMDDSFTIKRERFDTIIDQIIDEKLDIQFRIRSRVNAVDDKMLKKLKKAGCNAVNYGMESGSDAVLRMMNKKTTAKLNGKACIATKKAGIRCQTSWIAGYPGETEEMWNETLDFVRTYLPNTFGFNDCLPYPNTKVYNDAKESGNLVGSWDVDCDDVYLKTQMRPNITEYRNKILKDQRKILLSVPFILQTIKYLIANPNMRLLKYGINVMLKKINRLSPLKVPEGGRRIF